MKLRKSGLGLLSRVKEVKRGMGGERVKTTRKNLQCHKKGAGDVRNLKAQS